ncbi:bifunctional aldolase/short-chain dehydrogenase [Microbacterium rhizosphaerae]|uniref:Bifunctional aldolase/short-chain dehydrogenase n=2 Tax=Actinomycetes TaxID=1760 RepID=A0ABZ0SQZ3_9MICO|nr:bifunctional aldolase/short-chain dehydrogenase [Microbacterium rhizosphaerae]WPR91389.1 bifunctional aldolase/short-chain dehydrogenase [Microbacterium rhizosphaerae]
MSRTRATPRDRDRRSTHDKDHEMTNPTAADLIARSNRLGADPRNTNYAGGNTSAKGTEIDPVTGEPVELLWVKGSGGDLGTLRPEGLAVLRLDRLRALVDVYTGADRPWHEKDDEMVAAFDYCLFGKGGAAPSIDTAMHGLVDAAHVDHLHPDSGIAIATAADGEELTRRIFGEKVVWVPWRRPGFQLGLDIAEIKAKNPQAIGCILGGHGITAWGETSQEAEQNSTQIIASAAEYIEKHGKAEPFGGVRPGFEALPEAERRAKAAALAPTIRGLASTDKPMVGHFTDSDVVLDFLASEKAPALAELGTSCPDHFLRTKVKPMILDLPAAATVEASIDRLKELHEQYRAAYTAYYDAHASTGSPSTGSGTAEPASPAMRGADPLIVLVPGVGMFSYGANKQTARVAGEFYVNAINVMRGAEALSTYTPISDAEKFRIEYWALEEAKLQRMPKPKTHQGRIAFVTGAASGIGKAIATRLAAEGACVVVADLDLDKAQAAAAELGSADVAIGVAANVADAEGVQAAIDATLLAFGGVDLVVNNAGLSLSKPLLETTEKDWNLQHDVMAKGSFLVSKAAAKALIEQGLGGDIIYISSKNSVFAGPNNIAYSATKADQAHQVRLLAVELGEHGVRVNGINPDGVVRGSGIFASGWGANRAATYGVKEEDLGQFYANRTILKREVVPENVADAVYVLTGPELSRTTGLHIPVDSGVAAAFLR